MDPPERATIQMFSLTNHPYIPPPSKALTFLDSDWCQHHWAMARQIAQPRPGDFKMHELDRFWVLYVAK